MNRTRRAAVIGLGLLLGLQTGGSLSGAENRPVFEALDFFSAAFDQVRAHYVEPVDERELAAAAVQGMLSALDPHSYWLNPREYEAMTTETRGEFGGLGIEVTLDRDAIRVVAPIDDTPAAAAGLRAGDYITHLDGESVRGLPLDEAVSRMRGLIGSAITLTIVRPGQEPFDVKIVRDRITVRAVWSRLEQGNVGYIRISHFSEQAQTGLESALESLNREAQGRLAGYVLDLRNNPGGLLDKAISVADTFLEQGLIVSTRGRDPSEARDNHAQPGDDAAGLPLVVLINDGTASASEIVAGALQDHGRGIVMGTRSFGKGSVQRLFPMHNGGALKLTTQRYYTPSGRSIQGRGIDPDIRVEPARIEVLSSEAPREADLRNALENDQPPAGEAQDPAVVPGAASGAAPEAKDFQLQRAIDLIQGVARYRTLSQAGKPPSVNAP